MNIQEKIKKYIFLVNDMFLRGAIPIEEQQAIAEIEKELLKAYCIPISFEISFNLQNATSNETGKELTVAEFEEVLRKTATEYLQSNAVTDKQLLENAKESKTSYDNVFPFLGIENQTYPIFVYNELYCTNKININEALSALNKYRNDTNEIINALFKGYEWFEATIDFKVYDALKKMGYLYLEEYIQHHVDIRLRSIADDVIYKELPKKKLNNEIFISHFYIKRIEVDNKEDIIYLDIIFKEDEWNTLVIICNKEMFELIISHCRFNNQTSLVRSNIEYGVITLDFQNWDGIKQLEIIGLALEIVAEEEFSEYFSYYSIKSYTATNY